MRFTNASPRPNTARGGFDYSGYPHLAELRAEKVKQGRKGLLQTIKRKLHPRKFTSIGDAKESGASHRAFKGFVKMSDFFKNLFYRKREAEMQRKAEKSRENQRIEDEIEAVAKNITRLTQELKKKANG